MKKGKLLSFGGILLFVSIILTFGFLFQEKDQTKVQRIYGEEASNLIKSGQAKEVHFKDMKVILTDRNDQMYELLTDESVKEMLIQGVNDYNKDNTRNSIKLTVEPASTGWGNWVLLNSMPVTLLFFGLWGATLAVIVYVVRTLSRNRG